MKGKNISIKNIINLISIDTGLNMEKSKKAFKSAVKILSRLLANNKEVYVARFGTFTVKNENRKVIFKNKEYIAKVRIRFRPTRILRNLIKAKQKPNE